MSQLDWGAQTIARQPSFQAAKTVMELGAGNFSRTIALAQRHPDKQFYTTDYEFSELALKNIEAAAALPNVIVSKIDAHDMDYRDGMFDMVFSIALWEHIPHPDKAFREVERVLKSGGYHYFMQAPFWSCAKGHHFHHWDAKIMSTIPLYGHLYLDKDEMREVLHKRDAAFDIDHCIHRIYDRVDLSRLTREQTLTSVNESSLELVSWVDQIDTAYDKQEADRIFDRVRYPLKREEMEIVGAEVVQRRK